jgi:hypothetical protein
MPVDFLCHNGKVRINTAIWRTVFTWESGVVEVKLVDMWQPHPPDLRTILRFGVWTIDGQYKTNRVCMEGSCCEVWLSSRLIMSIHCAIKTRILHVHSFDATNIWMFETKGWGWVYDKYRFDIKKTHCWWKRSCMAGWLSVLISWCLSIPRVVVWGFCGLISSYSRYKLNVRRSLTRTRFYIHTTILRKQ